MIETNKPRLEDLPEGEELPKEEKVHFPIAGVILISALVIAIIAFIIVIFALTNKDNPLVTSEALRLI